MTDLSKQRVDTRVVVETPEGVDFEFTIAGPGKRAVAFLVDMLIKVLVAILMMICLGFFMRFGIGSAGIAIGMYLTVAFLLDWFYRSFFEIIWNGQTPGKRSQKLRVVHTNGTPVTPTSAIGRGFLLAADAQPFVLYTAALFCMLCTRRLQRLGDVVFDTMVIDENRERITRAAGLTHGLEPIPRPECSGKYSVPERTLAVIERLFEGDRMISDARREEIARPLSLALRSRLGWDEGAPDPSNPHTFFERVPNRHTFFLRRILKTFSDTEDKEQRSSLLAQGLRQTAEVRPSRMRRSAPVSAQERRNNLDDWLEEEMVLRSGGDANTDSTRLPK
ncbi:MAG: RDD family protein [Planctomycetaceae bacterium]|nr:RDD family protein [Planctomycetaceae bacterium]